MKKIMISFLFVLCFGCTSWTTEYDDSEADYMKVQELTVDIWIEHYGFITNGAREAIDKSIVIEVSFNEISKECGNKAVGCYLPNTKEILIKKSKQKKDKECTIGHEYLHLLSRYCLDDSDSDHSNPELWDEFGEDSLEHIICQSL